MTNELSFDEARATVTAKLSKDTQSDGKEAIAAVLRVSDSSAAIETVAQMIKQEGYNRPLLVFLIAHNNEIKIEHRYGDFVPCHKGPYPPYVIDLGDSLNEPIKPEALFAEILGEVKTFVDAPEEMQIVIAVFIMLSYLVDLFHTVPYLYFTGDNESGKSVILELFNRLGYRPLLSPSLPSADIYRYYGKDEAVPYTLLEDEAETLARDPEKVKILKCGYKKGGKVPRINEHGVQEFFNCYGLKVCAGEKLPHGPLAKGLLERFLVFIMTEGNPLKDEFLAEDFDRFAKLRTRLLLWRLQTVASTSTLDSKDYPWLRKRPRELWKAALIIAKMVGQEPAVKRAVARWLSERKTQRAMMLEALLTKIILTLVKEKQSYELEFLDIWAQIKIETDTEELQHSPQTLSTDDYGYISKGKTGRRLREVFAARPKRVKNKETGKTTVRHLFDREKLDRAAKRYGYRVTELPIVPRDTTLENTENGQIEASTRGKEAQNEEIEQSQDPPYSPTIDNSVTQYPERPR